MIFMDNTKPYPSSEPNLFDIIKDEKNKEIISRGSLLSEVWSFITKKKRPLTPAQVRLLHFSTPEERQACVDTRDLLLGFGWAVLVYALILVMLLFVGLYVVKLYSVALWLIGHSGDDLYRWVHEYPHDAAVRAAAFAVV